MAAEVGLRSLYLEDHVEENPTPEFRNIISSESQSDAKEDLFRLVFRRVDSESPELLPVYEGIPMNLDVAVSTINVRRDKENSSYALGLRASHFHIS